MDDLNQIHWPPRYNPASFPVHVQNKLEMASPVETVWAWLIRAQLWQTWYPNAANIQFLKGKSPDLALGTRFKWKTFSLTVESTVMEYVPPERIAWDAHAAGFEGYHAWIIQKVDKGCTVLTEEIQRGWLPRLQKAFAPHRMEHFHQLWLERLRDNAAKGAPPSVG